MPDHDVISGAAVRFNIIISSIFTTNGRLPSARAARNHLRLALAAWSRKVGLQFWGVTATVGKAAIRSASAISSLYTTDDRMPSARAARNHLRLALAARSRKEGLRVLGRDHDGRQSRRTFSARYQLALHDRRPHAVGACRSQPPAARSRGVFSQRGAPILGLDRDGRLSRCPFNARYQLALHD
jgi:hypothetical protein